MPAEYRLKPPGPPAAAPVLDPSQRAVVQHAGGPLLVLAGPGTGKTTTIVEVVVDRIASGYAPEDILVMTFSRKAAEELRSRIAARLGATASAVSATTFHAWCHRIVRSSSEEFSGPLRLLSTPEAEWRVAEIVLGSVDLGRVDWPAEIAPALRTRGLAREIVDFLSRARSLGPCGGHSRTLGRNTKTS